MRARHLAFAIFLATAAPAAAQRRSLDSVQVRVEKIVPGVAVLFGAGGNIGLSYGEDGNVLIDDQFAPLTDRIVAAIGTLDPKAATSPTPVKFVLNTHWHGDHTGGNENLAKRNSVVMAHDNVRHRMEAGVRGAPGEEPIPPSPKGALPVVTFADGVSLHLNGDTLRVIHVEHAHTDGDALVFWSDANVLHMGDTYFNGMLPFIDLDSGGSIDGAIAAAEKALSLTDDMSVIIPGHGPVASKADLIRYRDMLVKLREGVAGGIAADRPLEMIKAERLADAYGKPDDFISPDAFIETVYKSIMEAPHKAPHEH